MEIYDAEDDQNVKKVHFGWSNSLHIPRNV